MTLLEAKDISIALGGARILSSAALTLASGEMLGLIGPNGAGKTTLLRVLAGLLEPSNGSIRLQNRPANEIGRQERARLLAYLPQDGGSHWSVSVETVVAMGRLPHLGPWRSPSQRDRDAISRALEACDVAQFAERTITTLSGGERARVLLARALAGEPQILLADEPVAGLDPAHQLEVMQTLRTLARSGAGIVVVMHDLSLAARFCDRLVMLFQGTVAAEGPPGEVLSPELLAKCYGITAERVSIDGVSYILPVAPLSPGEGDAPH